MYYLKVAQVEEEDLMLVCCTILHKYGVLIILMQLID